MANMNERNTAPDVLIIGGGPAGLSAALWCLELGLEAVLFEKANECGGQLLQIYNPIKNYIGLETANGREMLDHFLRALGNKDSVIRVQAAAAEIDPTEKSIVLESGERYSAKALIIATGVRRRKLGVEGEDRFKGKGIIDSGSKEKEKAKDKTVLIVGGGDAALENALILGDYAAKICVVHRSASFRARQEFIDQAMANNKIEFRPSTTVQRFIGGENLEIVELANVTTGMTKDLAVDLALIRIGVEPNTELLRGKLDLDNGGYILVNSNCETNVSAVFAVGDAANPIAPTISTASGTGATAAKAIRSLLNRQDTS